MAHDILGLGGPDSTVKNLEGTDVVDAPTMADEESRRRRRMSEGADEVTPAPTGVRGDTGGGATGVDLGAADKPSDLE
jgi:hypothetical protein